MARPRSRFGNAAKRRRDRIPSRATRLARSPREPSGAILAYRMGMRRLAAAFERAVKRRIWNRLDEFAGREERRADASEDGSTGSLGKVLTEVDGGALRRTIEKVADKTKRHSKSEFRRLRIHIRKSEPNLDKLVDSWRDENVKKIRSLLEHELEVLKQLLKTSRGRTVKQLADRIEERFAVTRSKAELLARDQTLTLNAQVNQHRQKAAGIEEYIWTTAGDERVRGNPSGRYPDARPSHWHLDGKRFRYDDPPVSGVNGERQNPGEPINCRCQAYPVLPELEDK
jgi:SPP1 gp7 family putative phage head morphogenesis protein